MSGSGFRSLGYFLLDDLKGSKIRKNLIDIDDKMNGRKDNLEELTDLLENMLKKMYHIIIMLIKMLPCDFLGRRKMTLWQILMHSSQVNILMQNYIGVQQVVQLELFKSNQNMEKRNRTIADLIYFHNKNKWRLGEKYVYLRAWTSKYSVSKLRVFLQNYIEVDVVNFNDEQKELLRTLLKKDKRIKVVIGYASQWRTLCITLKKKVMIKPCLKST